MKEEYKEYIKKTCKNCVNKFKGLCYIRENQDGGIQCVYYKKGKTE